MENLTIVEMFAFGVIIATAMFCYADARLKARWIVKMSEEAKELRKEMREWQNKALIRNGASPLDKTASLKKQAVNREITPKIVTRQQLEYRVEDEGSPNPVTIHAHDVSSSRVARTVEKAAEIIAAHK
jgi:hypothetical protein